MQSGLKKNIISVLSEFLKYGPGEVKILKTYTYLLFDIKTDNEEVLHENSSLFFIQTLGCMFV